MLSLALALAAALLFLNVDMKTLRSWISRRPFGLTARQVVAVGLVALAIAVLPWQLLVRTEPTPAPESGPLNLRGLWRGPTASEDASLIGALCSELADEIEWDGMQNEPSLKTGVSLDELRKRARQLRCKGISIGERQPVARDAIADYLEQKVGVGGGDLTAESRSAWVSAFRAIGGAASEAAQ